MKANHIYRIIWSDVLEAWVAASEIARTRGKRSGRAALQALPFAFLTGAALAQGAPTTVVPTGGQTTAYVSANGVPVVNINAANTAGLSHNQFTTYNVDSRGLVLNNGNITKIEHASELAGSVRPNPNLVQQARVILNEVVSTNRSTLAGFTEVAGGRADVVVANPNGITCSGCGFLNTDRATLTTGTPLFSGTGALTGFAVDRGDVSIQGPGLNASGQQILDLVARSVRIEGPVATAPTGSLQIVAGTNRWSYETREVTGATAGSGPAPSYAIDSTLLGGMYSGRINLIATEGGVGVRMLGDAAAGVGDFRIDAAGHLTIQSQLSAQGNLSASVTGAGAGITLVDATSRLSAKDNLTVTTTAGGGGSIDNAGLMIAGRDLEVAADLSVGNSSSAAISAPLGRLVITARSGDISNDGWLYAGTQLTATADNGTLTNSNNGMIWSEGSMTLGANSFVNNNWIQAAQDIAITTRISFRNETAGGMPGKVRDDSTASNGLPYEHHYSLEDAVVYHNSATVWQQDSQAKERFDRDVPSDDAKPIGISAGRNMTIDSGAGALYNTGATISAENSLTFVGTGSLDNNTLFLNTNRYSKRYALHDWYDVCLFGLCVDEYYDYYAVTTAAQYATNEHIYYSGDTLIMPSVPWTFVGRGSSVAEYWSLGAKAQSDAQWIPMGSVATEEHRKAVINAGGTLTMGSLSRVGNESYEGHATQAYALSNSARSTAPTNPNGYFVTAKDSSARYLIESNPAYGLGSDTEGSDRLLKSLGLDPQGVTKRLGDANYEAFLIRQQLIGKTGSAVLDGYANEAKQMERLMDQAAGESKALGLTIGKALSAEQVAKLKQDIVWMVETKVEGQTVLKPVVYLSEESRKSIRSGSVIAGREVNMNVGSLSNTGGDIRAERSLNIKTQGDITNTSGTIKGAEVELKSTEGSIVNRTSVRGYGDITSDYRTVVGKTATIEAAGSLGAEANKDITVEGAAVKAGGAATLDAGGDITVTTIVDKTTTTSKSSGGTFLLHKTGPTETTVSTERNIGSTISTGGNLTLKSGGDTTVAGSKADVGGNLAVDTGGDFNVVAKQDVTKTHTETSTTGLGVGGGLWGTEKKTVDDFKGTNVGSSISVGGDADMTRIGKELTLRGSNLAIGGAGTIKADSVKIEQGLDERHTVTRTESTTFLSTGSNKQSNKTGQTSAESGRAAASTGASAAAGASESSELNVMEKRTTTVDHTKTSGVASHLTTGNNLTITARDNVTVQGSDVEAGKTLSVDAKSIDILAGENTEKTTTTSSATKIGIYTDSKAEAKSEAEASATGTSATAKTAANANASAASTVTIGTRLENSTDETSTLTHTSSSLKSGGDMSLKAKDEARFVGAKVESGGNLDIDAKDITSLAAQDTTSRTTDKTTRTTGIYLEGQGSAELKGSLKAGPGNYAASGGGGVSGEAGAGLRYSQDDQKSGAGSTRNVVSTFKAGGNVTRTAKDAITDQGTQLEAGKDISQSATTLKEIAAEDKTWSSSSSEKHDAKVGAYVGGSYQGDAGAQSSVLGTGGFQEDLGAEASAGVKAKYTYDKTSESRTDTTAVTSRYKAGGSISSTTTDKTTLIGTQLEAGKDVSITAGSIDYQAAKDTTSSSSESRSGSAEAKLKVYGTTGVDLNAGYEQSKSSATSSTARAGSVAAGGNVTITAKKGDVRLEGTGIEAGEKATVKSEKGSVTFDAAKNTSHEESSGFSVNAGFGSTSAPPKGAPKGTKDEKENKTTLSGGYSSSKGDSSTEQGVSIKARNVDVSAEKDVTMRGTQVDAKDTASVTAQTGEVKLLEAVSSTSSSSFGVSGKVTGMRKTESDGAKSSAQYGGANVNVANDEQKTGTATSIKSGGDLTVKGRSVTSQEAQLSAGGTRKVEGTVVNQDLTRVDKGMKVDVNIDGSRKSKPAAKAEEKPSPAGKSAKASDKKVKPPTKTKAKTKPTASNTAKPAAAGGAATSPAR